MIKEFKTNYGDSHNHSYLEENFIDVITNANYLSAITLVGLDVETSLKALNAKERLNDNFPNLKVFTSAGLHPHDASKVDELKEIEKLLKEKKFDAIGETGLDYYYLNSKKNLQIDSFKQHISWANEFNLPLIIHVRDAWDDLKGIFSYEQIPNKTILHCFTGSTLEAKWATDNNIYISLSGIITYKNAIEIQESAKIIPNNLLLVETDSPYLAPVPYRGKPNQPQYLESIIDCLAKIKNQNYEDIASATLQNMLDIFS